MTDKTLDKANEIRERISKYENENKWMHNEYYNRFFTRTFGIRKPVLRAGEKLTYEMYFDLEQEDVSCL